MKTLNISLSILLLAVFSLTATAQEKKIKFDKGILKICSNKNFNITGYDGKEVIIQSNNVNKESSVFYSFPGQNGTKFNISKDSLTLSGTGYSYATASKDGNSALSYGQGYSSASFYSKSDSTSGNSFVYLAKDSSRKQGLKKLGSKYENEELGIHFKIEEKDGVLLFKDFTNNSSNSFVLYSNESYDIKIPNSVKLVWKSDNCQSKRRDGQNIFYNSKPSTLSDFSGEVEVETTLNNVELNDVTGLVAINNVGGNVTITFDKKKPENLYSIYSNNGFIDMQIPKGSDITVDASAKSIYSDVDFKIIEEKELNDFGHVKNAMILKYGSGKVKIKLDAGYGNVYLRKK